MTEWTKRFTIFAAITLSGRRPDADPTTPWAAAARRHLGGDQAARVSAAFSLRFTYRDLLDVEHPDTVVIVNAFYEAAPGDYEGVSDRVVAAVKDTAVALGAAKCSLTIFPLVNRYTRLPQPPDRIGEA